MALVIRFAAVLLVVLASVEDVLAVGGSMRINVTHVGGTYGRDSYCVAMPVAAGQALGYSLSRDRFGAVGWIYEDTDGVWRGLIQSGLISNGLSGPGYMHAACAGGGAVVVTNASNGVLLTVEMRPVTGQTPFGEWEIRWGKPVATNGGAGVPTNNVSTGNVSGCALGECVSSDGFTPWCMFTGIGIITPIRSGWGVFTVYNILVDQFVAPYGGEGGDGGDGGDGEPPELDFGEMEKAVADINPDAGTMDHPSGSFGFDIPISGLAFSGAPTMPSTVATINGDWYRDSAAKAVADVLIVAMTAMGSVMMILNELRKGGGED